MGDIAKGLSKALGLGGGGGGPSAGDIEQQRQAQEVAMLKQRELAEQGGEQSSRNLAILRGVPRGRRAVLSSGETGLSRTLG